MAQKGIVALAIVFLVAHLPFLPPTLEDIDSINFALGVRHFDVARHQPHPPGYPLFIALAKVSTPVLRAAGIPSPEPRGLAVWSAISGATLVLLLVALFRALDGDARRAGWAAVVAVFCPLFWFTALRPLSDTTGLAVSVAAQALIVATLMGRGSARSLVAGAFVAGLAIGFRSQSFLLTLPLLGLALVVPREGIGVGARAGAVGALAAGALAWAIPLVVASGGLAEYAAALGTQAGEDFSGVVMLWNMRTPRVAVDALRYSFLWPWAHPVAGVMVLALAIAGSLHALWRAPRLLGVLVVGFVPYAIFHLLFHEVVTVRYALPLIVPVAYLVTFALDALPRRVLPAVVSAAVVMSLIVSLPASIAYARDGSPAFGALRAAATGAAGQPGDAPAVGFHAVARRAAEWLGNSLGSRVLKAPHGREWLSLIEQWRAAPRSTVWFVADPRRTDLALFDPTARERTHEYRWAFVEPPFVGGARPGDSDLYRMSPPGWMLERGWAVTPEVAGITAKDGSGPHVRPSVAWIRTRADETLLMLGGRNLGAAGAPASRINVTLGGRVLHEFDAAPGFFFQLVPLPAGTFAGTGYVPLVVTAHPINPSGQSVPVGLEQFDVQAAGTPMIGAEGGWQEPEFNPLTYRSWRWTTERATLWVRPIGRDVTLTLSGESPLKYFDTAPGVSVTVGGTSVAHLNPSSDFTQDIVLPAAALARAEGHVVIESDKWFVPGERDGGGDKRHLALRIYSYAVR